MITSASTDTVTVATLAKKFSFVDGMAGIDCLTGGAGNDTYTFDIGGDVVREDTVAGVGDGRTVDFVGPQCASRWAFVERLTLSRGAERANGAIADGMHSVVFVAGSTEG